MAIYPIFVAYLYKCIKNLYAYRGDSMEDLRITKTKKALYIALLDLMKEETFENIKVSDICEKALINRSTFYAHYSDKYELVSSFIKNLTDELKWELEKNEHISTSKAYYLEMLRLFFSHVEKQKEAYASILINNRNSIMMDMVYKTLDEDIKKHLPLKTEIPSDIVSKFYLGAVFNIGVEWLNSNNQYTKEEIMHYLDLLIPDLSN